jgi:hypothetical protein
LLFLTFFLLFNPFSISKVFFLNILLQYQLV